MSTAAVTPEMDESALAGMMQPGEEQGQASKGQDPTSDDPNTRTPKENQEAAQLTEDEKQKLLWLRREFKMTWATNRRAIVRRVLKAFEVLKGNAYTSFDPDGFQFYDAIGAVISGANDPQDVDLYKFNNNIYQMLWFSFLAALAADASKSRFMPDDADDETDLATARRASTVEAEIERKNNIKSLQKQELTHLWTGGTYFSHVRHVVDSDRVGVLNEPVWGEQEVNLPDRFLCPECGEAIPANEMTFRRPQCDKCNAPLSQSDFHPGEPLQVPVQVGTEEVPAGGVLISIFGASNVDAAPYAQELYETPILDLEVEVDISAIRSAYPGAWDQLKATNSGTGSPESDTDRIARLQMLSSNGARNGYLSQSMMTYSRCWFQPDAFNRIDDKKMADGLRAKFPKGCKLVSAGGTEFLEAVPAKLTDEWTWCGTARGFGLYPPAVGDASLDVQDRINDVANIVHEHMDRNASPTILVDEDAIDSEAMAGKAMPPGTLTPIKRKTGLGGAKALADIIFQPQFHVDASIYNYGDSLVMLAQLLSGVQPQVFGGSDPNVQTKGGQAQMLNTALGRLALFLDQTREEHATRAGNAVKCFARNMDDEARHVIEGDSESGYENEFILLTEMQGSFHAYPESDAGFPASYAEIRDRLMDLLSNLKKNPFLMAFLDDPDNVRTIARYTLPPNIKVPGDDERTKIKRILGQLAKMDAIEVPDPMNPGEMTYIPTVFPDRDFDDMEMVVKLARQWGQKHWMLSVQDPLKFENVRAYLRIAAQYQAESAAAQAVTMAAQAGGGPGGPEAPGGPAGPEPAGAPPSAPPSAPQQ